MTVSHFTIGGPVNWYKRRDREIFLGDVVNETNGGSMSVGFGRYRAGETNEWTVTYDEALIITKGAFTVRFGDDAVTARAGEAIWITAGESVAYHAEEDCELAYVSYPPWMAAQRASEHAAMLDNFEPA